MSPGSFLLTKYYLDCVSPAGDVAIAYAARLTMGPLTVGAGILEHHPRGGGEVVRRRWSYVPPRLARGALHWRHAGLGVRGTWSRPRVQPVRRLLETREGAIDWRLLQPGAPASISWRGGRVEGSGYAELLRVSIPPWRFPFRALHWGRFVADDGGSWAAWINWCGGLERSWRWQHGEGALAAGDDARVLHDRNIAESALGAFAALARFLPRGFSGAREAKRLSRGRIGDGGAGWIVSEEAMWRA